MVLIAISSAVAIILLTVLLYVLIGRSVQIFLNAATSTFKAAHTKRSETVHDVCVCTCVCERVGSRCGINPQLIIRLTDPLLAYKAMDHTHRHFEIHTSRDPD